MMHIQTTKQSKEREAFVRNKILSAAYDLFTEKGFYNVTILKITEKAKVSKHTLYNHFQGKPSILKDLVEMHFKTGHARENKSISGIAYVKY